MAQIDVLLEAYEQARQVLQAAEADALVELVDAKAKYRENPNPGRLKRKKDAVEAIQRIRAAVRADRAETRVGGDAVREG